MRKLLLLIILGLGFIYPDCSVFLCEGGSNAGSTCIVDANCEDLQCDGGTNDGSACTADADCEPFTCAFDPAESCVEDTDCSIPFPGSCSNGGVTCSNIGGNCVEFYDVFKSTITGCAYF